MTRCSIRTPGTGLTDQPRGTWRRATRRMCRAASRMTIEPAREREQRRVAVAPHPRDNPRDACLEAPVACRPPIEERAHRALIRAVDDANHKN